MSLQQTLAVTAMPTIATSDVPFRSVRLRRFIAVTASVCCNDI